jgi:hypothetical protein
MTRLNHSIHDRDRKFRRLDKPLLPVLKGDEYIDVSIGSVFRDLDEAMVGVASAAMVERDCLYDRRLLWVTVLESENRHRGQFTGHVVGRQHGKRTTSRRVIQ